MAAGGSTPWTMLTASDDGMAPPRDTVSVTDPCVAGVANAHAGRSPPGAEITMRNRVPARKAWAMGSIGIRTRV